MIGGELEVASTEVLVEFFSVEVSVLEAKSIGSSVPSGAHRETMAPMP